MRNGSGAFALDVFSFCFIHPDLIIDKNSEGEDLHQISKLIWRVTANAYTKQTARAAHRQLRRVALNGTARFGFTQFSLFPSTHSASNYLPHSSNAVVRHAGRRERALAH